LTFIGSYITIFIYKTKHQPPADTVAPPLVIAPASALSPILPTGIPLTNTVPEPAFKFATWSGHGGAGGCECETVGAPTTITTAPSAFTVPSLAGAAIVVEPVHACPVDKLSPTLQIGGIFAFTPN
jgi:hypothetical protein